MGSIFEIWRGELIIGRAFLVGGWGGGCLHHRVGIQKFICGCKQAALRVVVKRFQPFIAHLIRVKTIHIGKSNALPAKSLLSFFLIGLFFVFLSRLLVSKVMMTTLMIQTSRPSLTPC